MGDKQSKCGSTNKEDRVTHEFEWVVPNFQKLAARNVGYCKTKQIVAPGPEKCAFSLCLYPHGFNERTGNYVSVWLKKQSTKELSIKFTCAIVDVKGKAFCIKSVQENLVLESVMGWTTFCSRGILLDKDNELLIDGSLKLIGAVEVLKDNTIPNAVTEENDPWQSKSLMGMSDSFHTMLIDGIFADLTLEIGLDTLKVHKAVLGARSSLHQTRLGSPLHTTPDEIKITDVSLEGMEIVLSFIYTGCIGFLSVPMAMEVYNAAAKYELPTLRNICSTTLSSNFMTDNVIGILLLAYRHSDLELLELCLIYIDKNLRFIKGKPDWIDLMKTYPKLADKALFFGERKGASNSTGTKVSRHRPQATSNGVNLYGLNWLEVFRLLFR